MTNEDLKKKLQFNCTETPYEFDDETLEHTINFVKTAHAGQYDKMGFPYYTHPYRVCQLLKDRFGNSAIHTQGQINFACILALLHDVCEDTKFTPDMIANELNLDKKKTEELKEGLSYITHDKNTDTYADYIKKIAEAPIIYPVWVKFCDLLDNSSLDRIIVSNDSIFLTGEDTNRINRYLISIRVLRKRLNYQGTKFECDDTEIGLINNFKTPNERKRFEKVAQPLNS